MSKTLAALTVAALGATAAPAAADPTLTFDHPCYVPGEPMVLTGTGYTPSGPILLLFSHTGASFDMIGTLDATADPAGAFSATVAAPDLAKQSLRDEDAATANDSTKVQAGGGPPEAVAFGMFTVTDTVVGVRQWVRKPVRRKRVTVDARGFALDAGHPLYAHWVRSHRTVKTVRVGTLRGDCGDLKATMPQRPAGVKPGRYTVVFSTDAVLSRRSCGVPWKVKLP
jgi:hypothetical protein